MSCQVHPLDRAIFVATQAHRGQLDKAGRPYILHPLRVMNAVAPHGVDAMIVAVLHDVLEDCGDLGEYLIGEEQFTVAQLEAIVALTHDHEIDQQTYMEYVEHLADDELARVVKIADLRDNLTPERQMNLTERERSGLTKRYYRALRLLEGSLT